MNKSVSLCIVFLLIFGVTKMYAQTNINATGGVALGSGGTVSYSVGEISYTTNTGTNGEITQGMQHPFEISISSGNKQLNNIQLTMVVYPNPTTDYLELKINNYNNLNIYKSKLSYQLYDAKGRILENKKIKDNTTKVDMYSLVPSTYFISILSENKKIKVFKIIKK